MSKKIRVVFPNLHIKKLPSASFLNLIRLRERASYDIYTLISISIYLEIFLLKKLSSTQ